MKVGAGDGNFGPDRQKRMPSYQMLPRTVQNRTPLMDAGGLNAAIIYPAAEPGCARLARRLAAVLAEKANQAAGRTADGEAAAITIIADRVLMPAVNM